MNGVVGFANFRNITVNKDKPGSTCVSPRKHRCLMQGSIKTAKRKDNE